MILRTLFEKQVLIRIADGQTAFIYTAKWRLFSITRRIGVSGAGRDLDFQVAERGSIVQEEGPMLR